MFISKKKIDEAIKNAKEEVYREFERREIEQNNERWTNERFCDIEKRINRAFGDIDCRLTELEKRSVQRSNDIAVCAKY